MTLKHIFRENVKFYRKQLNLSQEKLAELSNLSTNYIGDIERTNRKVTIDTIGKIAKGLNVDPSLLLVNRQKWFYLYYNIFLCEWYTHIFILLKIK